jgi:hypothetical protein
MWQGWYATAVGLGLCLEAAAVRAEVGPAEGVRLSFVRAQSATDCIAAPALEREISRRMGRNPFAGPARQWIEGVVAAQAGFYEVQLFERDAEGRTLGARTLREATVDCHKLDDAIVLAIALIIDPTAPLAPPLPAIATTPGAPAAAVGAAQAAQLALPFGVPFNVSQSGTGRLTPYCSDRPASIPVAGRDAATQKESVGNWGSGFVSADAIVVGGVLPGAAPGVEVVARQPLESSQRLSLRLSALFLPEKRRNDAVGDFGYGLTAFELGACAGAPGATFFWFGCGALGAGAVHAVVHSPAPLEPGDRLWAALRIEAGLALRIVGPIWLDARLFDLVAAKRWQFRVNVNDSSPRQAFAQSALMPGAALGLAALFD